MNTHKILTFFIGMLILFTGCQSNQDIIPSKKIENTLFEKYPDAVNLEWDVADGFWVGEFRNEGFHYKAWFTTDAKWLMSEISDLIYEKNLPEEIIYDFETNRQCSKSQIENIYKVEYAEIEPRYLIEIEREGTPVYMFYLRKGDLFKEVKNSWQNKPIVIPQEILSYIAKKHDPETTIYDATTDSQPIKIKVFEKRYKTICFDTPDEWIATYWEVDYNDITEAALETFYKLTGEKEADKQYKILYSTTAQEKNDSVNSQKVSFLKEECTRAYVFKYGDKRHILIDEYGNEIKESQIPL